MYTPETIGPGGAFLDCDNDGWMDIYLVNNMTFDDYGDGGILLNGITAKTPRNSIGVYHVSSGGGYVNIINPTYIAPNGGAGTLLWAVNTAPAHWCYR